VEGSHKCIEYGFADRGSPPAWELDGGSKQIPSVKTKFVVKHYIQPWTWMDSLA
jgi:hypothetical protein